MSARFISDRNPIKVGDKIVCFHWNLKSQKEYYYLCVDKYYENDSAIVRMRQGVYEYDYPIEVFYDGQWVIVGSKATGFAKFIKRIECSTTI